MDEENLNNQGADEQASEEPTEERGSRMDAAKAWFRQMNAGADSPAPEVDMTRPTGERSAAGGSGGGAAVRSTGEQGSSGGPCRNCQGLEVQLRETEQKATESESLYKRMAADFENYRRRVDREREEFLAQGIQKFAEAMLPALDDMDRALGTLNAEMPSDKLLESLKLVQNRITGSMEKVGLKPLVALGEHFDPRFHEPVQEVETNDFPDGSVMQELRRGYILNEKVIRPALVNVASNSGGASQAQATEESPEQRTPATEEDGVKVYDLTDFADDDSVEFSAEGKQVQTESPKGTPSVDE
jgi:molecular chaperone GrpE